MMTILPMMHTKQTTTTSDDKPKKVDSNKVDSPDSLAFSSNIIKNVEILTNSRITSAIN